MTWRWLHLGMADGRLACSLAAGSCDGLCALANIISLLFSLAMAATVRWTRRALACSFHLFSPLRLCTRSSHLYAPLFPHALRRDRAAHLLRLLLALTFALPRTAAIYFTALAGLRVSVRRTAARIEVLLRRAASRGTGIRHLAAPWTYGDIRWWRQQATALLLTYAAFALPLRCSAS